MGPMRHAAIFAALALAGAALDLLTKSWACGQIALGDEVVIIEGFFSFGHTRNPGIIFGMFPNAKVIFLVVSILAVPAIVAIFAAVRKPRWIMTVSLGLILAGTLGNLYDRAAFSEVRDFIKFTYTADSPPWPLFNLADSYICVGVLLLSIEMLFFDEKKKKKKDESAGKAIETTPPSPEQGRGAAGPAAPPPDAGAPGPGPGPVGGDRPAPAG